MQKLLWVSLCLLVGAGSCCPTQAGDFTDALSTGSTLAGTGALSLVAAPLYLVGGTAGAASEATFGIVKLVGAGGESLTDLTLDALKTGADTMRNDATVVNCGKACTVNVTLANTKKEIPLVVRKSYVELNEKVAK